MRLVRFWVGISVLYIIFVVYGTLFPFSFEHGRFFILELVHSPWAVFFSPLIFVPGDIIGNILLFIPLGYFQGKLFFKQPLANTIFLQGTLAFFISYSVEYLQLYIIYRHTSPVDCIFNVMGAVIGVCIARHFRVPLMFARTKRHLRRLLSSRWALPTMAAWSMLVLEAWQPFNFSLSAENLSVKLTVLKPLHLSFPAEYWVLLARYSLVFTWGTSLLTAWLYDSGFRYYLLRSIGLSMMAGIFLEWSQWFVLSRMPGLPETLAVLAGCMAGGLVFQFMPKRQAFASGLFWLIVGLTCAYFYRFIPPGNMDFYKIGFYHNSLVANRPYVIVVSLINHMTLFWFMGFLGYYLVTFYKLMPRLSLLNATLFLSSFILTAKYAVKFSPLASNLRFVFPLLGIIGGISIGIWGVSCFKAYFRRNMEKFLVADTIKMVYRD